MNVVVEKVAKALGSRLLTKAVTALKEVIKRMVVIADVSLSGIYTLTILKAV